MFRDAANAKQRRSGARRDQRDQDGARPPLGHRAGDSPAAPQDARRKRRCGTRRARDASHARPRRRLAQLPHARRSHARRTPYDGPHAQGAHAARLASDGDHVDGHPRRRPAPHSAPRGAHVVRDDAGYIRQAEAVRTGFGEVFPQPTTAKDTQTRTRPATQPSPSRPPQPKPADSQTAIVAAIQAALLAGEYARASALLEVIRRTEPRGEVVLLRSKKP